MDAMKASQEDREANRAKVYVEELTERIGRATRNDGTIEALKGLHLNRISRPTALNHTVSHPGFCVIAQGSKDIFLEHEQYHYDCAHYLLVTASLPLVSQIREASPASPYLSLRLELDPLLVGAVLAEVNHRAPLGAAEVRAIDVSALDAGLLDATVRLIRLVDSPADAHFLAPIITREIIYRLLMGAQSHRLRHIAVQGAQTHLITKAIEQIRKDFNQPLRMDDLAQTLGMSVSSFHHHFKAVTAMSPLQFQKRVQLHEARRLMLGKAFDATQAAYQVGYSDVSHFSREYKRLFGLPPMRDVEKLRNGAGHNNVDSTVI